MKKKLFIIIAVCLVVAVALVAVLALRGCGDQNDESSADVSVNTEVSDTVSNTEVSEEASEPEVEVSKTPEEIEAATAEAKEGLDEVLSILTEPQEGETEQDPDFLTETDKLNGYEIISFKITNKRAIAVLRVYAPNLYSIAKELDKNTYDDEAELMAAINEAVKEAEIVEKEIELEFEKTEDGYIPVITSEFLDALYGGVFSLYDELLSSGQ